MRLAFALALVALASPAAADTLDLASKIEAVTVYPAGAEVTRAGRIKIPAGSHVLRIADLPAEAIEQSIRVEGKAAGNLEIGSVDTRPMFVPQHGEAAIASERKRIEAEIEKLTDARRIAEDRIAAADVQRSLVSNLAALPNRPPPAAGAGAAAENWSEVLALIGASSKDIARSRLEAEIEVRDIDRKVSDLQGRLGELAGPTREQTEVRIAVAAAAPVEADLTVSYQVPNASWTPSYDARLKTGTKTSAPSLDLLRRATISQNTGEAWQNVTLSLSTTRPTAGTAAPQLATMTVDFVPEPKPMPAPTASAPRLRNFDGLGAAREEPMADAEVAAMAAPEPKKKAAVRQLAAVQLAPFQAIYAVPGSTTVPNTGEAKSVSLATDSFQPALRAQAVPKRDAKAYLYAKLEMPRGSPVLPGSVALFRDGTFVGSGQLPLLAGGETHELGFGADDLVRVRHAIAEEKRGETGLISSSRTDERNYRLFVKNLHERAVDVTLIDQIPVSANEEIKVEFNTRTQPSRRDIEEKRGLLAWDMKVEPDEEKVVEFGYRVVWPAAKSVRYSGR